MSIHVELTDEIETMRKGDFVFTQESQQEAAEKIKCSKETKDQIIVGMARETLKLVEESPEMYNEYVEEMKGMLNRYRSRVSSKNLKEPAVHLDKSEGRLEMIPTGSSRKKHEKRKKPFYES